MDPNGVNASAKRIRKRMFVAAGVCACIRGRVGNGRHNFGD